LFYPFPKLGKMLLMLDQNSDENYQPMWVPLDGGYPKPAFGDAFAGKRVACCAPRPCLKTAMAWAIWS